MKTVPDPLLGTVIDGRYLIRARVAQGGMATVYKAQDQRLDRDVAVKVMHPHLADQDEFVQRFHREALATAKLSHPNVVSVYDEGTVESDTVNAMAYLVMEYISGDDLRTELSRRGSLPLGMALETIRQVLAALGSAHQAGLIHRDVKPENVMLVNGDDVNAKVTDFGLARAVAAARSTTAGTVLGTVAYLAPEVLQEQATARSDIYAAGIMLYELIAGDVPFTAETPIALAYKHVNDNMPRLSTMAPWIPSSVDSLIGLLTAKNPEQRPANGTEARDRVQAVLNDLDDIIAKRRVAVTPTNLDRTSSERNKLAQTGSHDTRTFTPAHKTAVLTAPPEQTKRKISRGHEIAKRRSGSNEVTSSTASTIWRWLIILLLIGASAAGVYWYFTAGPGMRIAVPDVAGRQQDAAVTIIETVGLTPVIETDYSDDIREGYVISSDPEPATQMAKNEEVTLTVSLGIEQVTVPSVVGLPRETATQQLTDNRLEVEYDEDYSQTVLEGNVIEQSIEGSTEVDHSSVVTLTVSLGREPVEIVDVTGQPLEEATETLTEIGLEVDTDNAYSDEVPEGNVIAQSTSGSAFRGDSVTLTISLGPELFEVPDVYGMSRGDATDVLEELGFVVEYEDFLGGVFNRVREQSIPAGEEHPRGTVITLIVV